MCGRFTRGASVKTIADAFEAEIIKAELSPSYNIAPTQPIAMIVNDGVQTLTTAKWGLIPAWASDAKLASKLINARAETLMEKASFKQAFRKRRCLIVADGFYEWKTEGKTKTPVYIHLKSGELFGFAGLYEVWNSPEGEAITTGTIITTEANELVAPIHSRMPVILPKAAQRVWLDGENEDPFALSDLLAPYDAAEMEWYEVSRLVNSPANNSPECRQPV